MKENKTLNKIKEKIVEFGKHSSLHGFFYFYESSNRSVITVWCVIILSCLVLCCFLGQMIWEKFEIDPTLTVVETTRYTTAEIPFPAVAICDHGQPVYGPKTKGITNLLLLRGYNRTQISEFYKSFSEVRETDYTPEPYVRKMHFHLEGLGYSYNNLLYSFMQPCNKLIKECSWRSQVHNCSDMFRPVYTVFGYCCQYDVEYFRHRTKTETNFVSGVQASEGLQIMVSGQRVDMDGKLSTGYVLLYNFDYTDKLSLLSNDVVITPQVYFDINLFMWVIDSSEYVKDLPLRKRKCFLDDDKGDSYDSCLTRIIIKKVVNQCRCLPFHFTAAELDVDFSDTCGWDQLRCVYKHLAKVQEDLRDVISSSGCYQRCDYVQYEAEVEYLKYHTHLGQLDESYSHISVHFSESTCIKYRREVLYSWDQMLANLGGIFGLCVGGSIISIIEIIWFILDLIFTTINIKCNIKNKIISLKRKHKVTTVNSKDDRVCTLTQRNLNSNQTVSPNKYKFVH